VHHPVEVGEFLHPEPVLSNGTLTGEPESHEEALYQRFKSRLISEAPHLLNVIAKQPEIELVIDRPVIRVDGTSQKGRLAMLIADGFLDEPRSSQAIGSEFRRRMIVAKKPNIDRAADELVKLGFLTKNKGHYQVVAGMKISVVSN
jgi:hypothetical protein